MNTLNIEIPKGKEIDWQESAKQQKIIFKDKFLTYKDVLNKLQNENAFTESLLNQLNAKTKLAQTCHVLNDGWSPKLDESVYILFYNVKTNSINIDRFRYAANIGTFCFKNSELAKQAIKILDKETLILALYDIW